MLQNFLWSTGNSRFWESTVSADIIVVVFLVLINSPFWNRLCVNFCHLLARKPNLETFSIYSSKFYLNFHLSESSFTCPGLWASGLAWIPLKVKIIQGLQASVTNHVNSTIIVCVKYVINVWYTPPSFEFSVNIFIRS